jgi:hypothetical protein
MMMEVTGFIPKVTGMRSEMVATGPIPGKTPIRVPIRTPEKQNRRLFNVKATLNPKPR